MNDNQVHEPLPAELHELCRQVDLDPRTARPAQLRQRIEGYEGKFWGSKFELRRFVHGILLQCRHPGEPIFRQPYLEET